MQTSPASQPLDLSAEPSAGPSGLPTFKNELSEPAFGSTHEPNKHRRRIGGASQSRVPANPRKFRAAVKVLEPSKVRLPLRPNRSDSEEGAESLDELCESINQNGGNTTLIEVFKLAEPADGYEYELIMGERRLKACLATGRSVNAVVRPADYVQQGARFFLENRFRVEVSPYDVGRQARHMLSDQGQFPSQRSLARAMGMDSGDLTKALQLAGLPKELVEVFSSPGELRFRDAKPIADAIAKNKDSVLAEAAVIKALPTQLSTNEIVRRLTKSAGVGPSNTKADELILRVDEARVGSMSSGRAGCPKITLEVPLNESQLATLKEELEAFCRDKVLCAVAVAAPVKATHSAEGRTNK